MDFAKSSGPLRIAERVLSGITFVACILTFGLLAATMDRGFDFFDDAFYLMAFRDRTPDVMFTSAFLYLRPVFDLLSGNIAEFRLFGMALIQISAALFAFAFMRWTRWHTPDNGNAATRSEIISAITISSLLFYFCCLRTPGYNMLVGCISFIVLGLTLEAVAFTKKRITYPIALVCGLFTGMLFFVKLTTFPLILAVCVALFLVSLQLELRTRIRLSILFLSGSALWICLHFLFLEPPSLWWLRESGSLKYIQDLDQSHSVSTILKYIKDSTYSCLQACIIALPSCLMLGLYLLWQRRRGIPKNFDARIAISALLLEVISLICHGYYTYQATSQPLTTGYCSFLLVAILIDLAISRANRQAFDRSKIAQSRLAVFCVIAIFPFATAVGTNNSLFSNALFAIAPFFAVILYVSNRSAQRLDSRILALAMPCLLSVLVLAQIAGGSFKPYGMNLSILQQTKQVQFSPPSNKLYVEASTRDFIQDLDKAKDAAGMKPSDDLLLFYDYPGIAYILDAHMPGTPWYFSYSPSAVKTLLSHVPIRRLQRSYVIDPGERNGTFHRGCNSRRRKSSRRA